MAVCRAIHWLQNYVKENPYTEAAKEARKIIYGLEALRQRPALDQLLALIGQIAKSDLGFAGNKQRKGPDEPTSKNKRQSNLKLKAVG
ncbi:MAG: hypothetical protein C5B58_02245 [Acidobacteria bacterium]|nr:MAG: hypothetical protein C5B58_02245 [Acidobacteriota bacterium]